MQAIQQNPPRGPSGLLGLPGPQGLEGQNNIDSNARLKVDNIRFFDSNSLEDIVKAGVISIGRYSLYSYVFIFIDKLLYLARLKSEAEVRNL